MQNFNQLVNSLYTGNISNEDFIRKYFDGMVIEDKYVADLLDQGIKNEDALIIEEAIVLIYAGSFNNSVFSLRLSELLGMSWHTRHEDIAMLLKDISDPKTIDYLFRAAELHFDYLDYDDTYQFARKCIKALSSIEDENALSKLKILSNSSTQIISEYAKKELHYKEIR